jgi:hypothetical protein
MEISPSRITLKVMRWWNGGTNKKIKRLTSPAVNIEFNNYYFRARYYFLIYL